MAEQNYDLVVIGAGPGGYVAAIRAAQLGMKVACVEKDNLGGTCLNIGCIPSKALLDSTEKLVEAREGLVHHGIKVGNVSVDLSALMKRKEQIVESLTSGVGFLFKKNKIDHIRGTGSIAAPGKVTVTASDGKTQTLSAARILIATGSAPIELPSLKFDGKHICSSTEALSLTEIPKKIILVGAGYIGVELGSVWARLGSEVIVLDVLERPLFQMDRELVQRLQRSLEKTGLKFRFKTTAESVQIEKGRVKLTWKSGDQSGVEEADKVIVCVGRRPVTQGLNLDKAGVKTDAKGYITVDPVTFQTSVPGIYAIGDVIGGVMLAHKAEEEAVACVERMNGLAGHVNYHTCPAVVYTHPELAQVGLTEDDAKARGPIKVGKYQFMPNGRAKALDETDGLVKIIADAETDQLLGVHILHSRASEMIHEAVVAMEFHASAEDLARSFHAHPTLNEVIKEAALAVDKRPIHG